ncbi:MAG: hypothetical protein IIB57_09980 [Planctomycetes bacterium]|nr:hypothetical protein [Planctomycetota bacterium]
MPKVVSEKQRRANRQNAQKSTGPKTAAGKARASRNALKHGLLAKDVVITGTDLAESRADFDAFLADLCAELKPQGLIEETMVERIATCYWRLRRVQRFEAAAIRGALDTADPDAPDLARIQRKLKGAEHALATESRLAALLDKPLDQRSLNERRELEQSLRDFPNAYALRPPDLEGPSLENHVRHALPNIIRTLQAGIDTLRAQSRTAENDQALRRARRPFIASLPDRDALLRVVRYENMLDRQIHRALAELRRRRNVPPVPPVPPVRHRDTRKNRTRKTKPFSADT